MDDDALNPSRTAKDQARGDNPPPGDEDPVPALIAEMARVKRKLHLMEQHGAARDDIVDGLDTRVEKAARVLRDIDSAAAILRRAGDPRIPDLLAAGGVNRPRHAAQATRKRPAWFRGVIKGGLAAAAPLAWVLRSKAHKATAALAAAVVGTGAGVTAVELPGPDGMPKAPAATVPWQYSHRPAPGRVPVPRPAPGVRPPAHIDLRAGRRHRTTAGAASHAVKNSPAPGPLPTSSAVPTGTPAPPPLPVPTVTPTVTPLPTPTCDPDGDECGLTARFPSLIPVFSSLRGSGLRGRWRTALGAAG